MLGGAPPFGLSPFSPSLPRFSGNRWNCSRSRLGAGGGAGMRQLDRVGRVPIVREIQHVGAMRAHACNLTHWSYLVGIPRAQSSKQGTAYSGYTTMHSMNMQRFIPGFSALLIALTTCFQSHAVTAFSPTASSRITSQSGKHTSNATTKLHAETDTPAERQPWDAFRFVRQSARFIRPPNPFRTTGTAQVVQPGDVIWSVGGSNDGRDAAAIGPRMTWAPLDDVVMGGVSSSEFDNNTGMWGGTVSSTNNGGFVGIRTTPFDPPLDVTGCRGIELRLRGGDAKRFKAVVRDSTDFNGVCWTSSFDAPGGRNGGTVRLPFDKQVPTIFANTVEGKTFVANNVVGFQLAYSKFEYDGGLNPKFALGDFSLQLVEVKAY